MKPDEPNRSRGQPLVGSEMRRGVKPIGPLSSKEMKLPVVKYGMKRQRSGLYLD